MTQTTGLIPDELLANIKKGDCVLFLGADLALGYEGAPPARPKLAQGLAAGYGLPTGRPWPETAQAYLNQYGDRESLVGFLRGQFAKAQPGPVHRAIAKAGFRAIVTAWYDDLLEKALAEAGYRVTRVVRDKSLHLNRKGEREVVIVKLCGCLSNDESLVLGAGDHDELMFRFDRKLEKVTAFCQLRPPLFVGFDPADPALRLLYTGALIGVIEQDRQAYVVWPELPDTMPAAWTGRNVHFVSAAPTPFLESLAEQVPAVVATDKGPIRVDRPPYKFLDYYEVADADIFCGRDTESQIVARLTLSHRLLTLFGPSGAGKTSLLLAGVLPRLRSENYAHVYVRALDDPLPAVRRAVAQRAGRGDWETGADLRAFLGQMLRPVPAGAKVPSRPDASDDTHIELRRVLTDRFDDAELRQLCFELGVNYQNLPGQTPAEKVIELITYLDRRRQLPKLLAAGKRLRPDINWDEFKPKPDNGPPPTPLTDKLVVVLDQFEELFIRVGSGKREAFFHEVAGALDRPERDVRFIFSLREDYLAHLDEAREHLPDVFVNSFRLAPLERGNARLAITEPAHRAGVTVEPGLVDALVGGEGRGSQVAGDLVEAGGRVPPAALQIVLHRLYRDAMLALGRSPDEAPPKGLALTQDAYQTVTHVQCREGEEARTLVGAEAILAGYIQDGLALLPDFGADPDLGGAILKVMVTSQETKAALTHAEILAALEEAGAIEGKVPRDKVKAEDTRLGLERVRLLRGFERDGVAYYELAHDHLAAEIATWITQEEMQVRLARELLHREMDNWRGAGLLIRPEVLALIHERRDELKQLSADELELLFRSALAAGYEVAYWFERARAGGVAAGEIALAGLDSDNFRTRAWAVEALGQLGEQFVEPIIERLADDYPQVRVAAIFALERLRPDGEWRERLVYECYVPAGEFVMGDDQGDKDEKPAHTVYLDAYYVARCPVTNADYKRYMDDIERAYEIPQGKTDHPVVNVSWYDSRDYAVWAGMRLLTEAEWEKAASWEAHGAERGSRVQRLVGRRAGGRDRPPGRKRKYPWGDEFDKARCNTFESGVGGTTPVGKYSPDGDSPYGCCDMAGNVWEWTSSEYKSYPYDPEDGREDTGSTRNRVVRGGAFSLNVEGARCASRNHRPEGRRHRDYGCRVGVAAPFSRGAERSEA